MVSFINFYFHFLANVSSICSLYLLMLRNPYVTQTVSLGYLCTCLDKNNMIYTREQEGLYQNKVTSSLISTCSCKMAY